MNVMELVARLSLDNTQYLAGLTASEGKAMSFSQRAGNGIKKLGKVAAGAMAAATTAVVAFGVSSVKTGMEFDKSMSQVYATMGDKADEMITDLNGTTRKASEVLRDFAQEMGATTQYTASESAQALNYMALAGYDAATSMDMLPNVMNLASAGAFDLAKASDMLTDTQTALGWDIERTTHAVDEWAKAASTGNTSVEQLGDAFLTVGGLAKELNDTYVTMADGSKQAIDGSTELTIALTAMANAGIKGSEAGTHMRNMLLKLASPTSEGTKQLEAMGVSVFDAEGNMRSLHDIMGDLNGAMSKMTQQEKIQAISDLFNARDIASAEALLSAVEEDWDGIGQSIVEADGAAEEMKKKQLDNLAGDITMFKSALDGAKIALSDGLSPALRKFVQTGTKGLSEFAEKMKGGDFVGAAESIGQSLGNVATKVISKLPQLVSAGLALLKGIISGIAAQLPSVLSQLYSTMMTAISAMSGTIASELPALIGTTLTKLVDISGKIREKAGAFVSAGLEIIKSIAKGIIQNIPTIIQTVPTILTNFAGIINDNAPKVIATGVQIIAALVKGLVSAIPTIVANLPQIIAAIWNVFTAVNWLALGKQVITAIGNGIKSVAKSLPDILKSIGQRAWNAVKGISWKSLGSTVLKLIGSGISALVNFVPNLLKSIASKGMKLFTGVSWGNVGKEVITSIARGITGAVSLVTNAVQSMITKIKNMFPFNIGKIFSGSVPEVKLSAKDDGNGNASTNMTVKNVPFAKAMAQPYMFTKKTLFNQYAGEAGDELLYGKAALMRDMREAVRTGGAGGDIIINLNYDASADANDMLRDLARGVQRYKMAGAI